MKILVVEDDYVSRKLLTALLKDWGATDVAVNGKDALEKFIAAASAKDPYRLILLDIMMPELDGHAVLREIRKHEEKSGIDHTNEVKVIMTTALDDRHNIMEAFRSQCEGYIVKPISQEQLHQQLELLGFHPLTFVSEQK